MNILIVEDNFQVAKTIAQIVKSLGHSVIAEANSFNEAISSINNNSIDIALLDIDLKGKKTGIDLAWWIKENTTISVIYLSGNFDDEIVSKAINTNPITYLVKPISKHNLNAALLLSERKVGKQNQTLGLAINAFFLKIADSIEKVEYQDILFIKSEHVYLEINLKHKRKLVIREKLNSFYDEHLKSKRFLRVHQRFALNIEAIEKVEKNNIYVIDGSIVPISKSYISQVKDLLQNN